MVKQAYLHKIVCVFLCIVLVCSMFSGIGLTAFAEETAQEETVIDLDFNAAGQVGLGVEYYTEEEDGWAYDAEDSYDVTPTFYQNAKWDYHCLRLTQTAAGGTAVLNIQAPVSGKYNMELIYGVGNNANYVDATVGGTTVSYFAWANWGTDPKTVTAENVVLSKGSNEMTFSTPEGSTAVSLILVKQIIFTLVEATEEEPTVVKLDFNAAKAAGNSVDSCTLEKDGWAYDSEKSTNVSYDFYQYTNNADASKHWDYYCLRLRQTAADGLAVVNFNVPVAGIYKMDLTYGVGNNGNQTEVYVGGTTTAYHGWANWGDAPKSVSTENIQLAKGKNSISFTTLKNASMMLIKEVTFTLVEALPEEEATVVLLDFNADSAKGKTVASFTMEEDGWEYNTEKSSGLQNAIFFGYTNASDETKNWDYKCLRFTQNAKGGTGAISFRAPISGTYTMDLTYCTGNSGNATVVEVGGTTTEYHAWANWGAAPKTVTTQDVKLTQGSNLLTISAPEGSASYLMLKEIKFTLVGAIMVSSVDGLAMRPDDADGIALSVTGIGGNGLPLDLSNAAITYESLDAAVLSVTNDGIVMPVSVGNAQVAVCVTMADGTVYETTTWISVSEGKVAPTYYTQEKREAAVYNAYHYNWGKKNRVVAVKAADDVLENLDAYYDMIPFEGIPRTETCGMDEDPLYQNCPMCNVDLTQSYGNYGWLTDALNDPWKVKCPSCGSRFPSNDFESYYKSGLDAAGVFHKENADTQYLVNELYPEKGEGWGVDDGWGWNTGETYTNAGGKQSPRIYAFVACFNGKGIWSGQGGSVNSVSGAINTLRDAYLYTGDIKYGRAGAILIDRVADVYPTMSLTDAVYNKPRNNISYLTVSTLPAGTIAYTNNHGTYFQGKILGCISESNYFAKDLLKAYDAFYPAFDDPEVIAYLSARAEQQGMVVNGENPKDTPHELRENGINGIVHEVSEGVRNRDIWGNFGLAQSTLALAAIVLATEEQLSEPVNEPLNMATGDRRKMNTNEMIAWLYEDGPHAQKNMFNKIIKSISRDGHGDEVSPNYHMTWIRNLIDFADIMKGYEGYPGTDLYENPRFVKMLVGNLALTVGGNTTLQNGDSGSAGGIRIYLDQNAIVRAYQATGNAELAQALYFLNGGKSAGLIGDMFDPEAGLLTEKVQAVIDEYGPYDVNKSVLLAGYGQALLKDADEAGENESLYGLWFGRIAGGHGNRNALDLSMFAYGLNYSPALGYPKAANNDLVRNVWERGTVSRNTVVIDDASQESYTYLTQYPNSDVYHFEDNGSVKVMDAEGTKAYPNVAEEYRRTIVTVQGDDEAHYAVDFFRVLGGSTHLYSFHAAAENYPVSDSIQTVAQNGGTYAGADVEYGENVANGYSFLYDVQTDASPENSFYLDCDIVDSRNILSDASGLHLRLNMLSTQEEPFTEVSFAKGCPPAKDGNPEYYPYALIRKDGGDSLFTAVYEPYRNERYLSSMELVDVVVTEGTLSETDRAAAVKVLRADGKVDYIVYCTNYDVVLRVDDRFNFSGFVGVITYESEAEDAAIHYGYGVDATLLAGTHREFGAVTGKVVDFTKELDYENTITIQMDQQIAAEDLVGRVIYVDNDGTENGAYTIYGAILDGENVVLDLGDQSLVRALQEPANVSGGYVYNIAAEQTYRIPLALTASCEHLNTTSETVANADKTHTTTVTCSDCDEVVSTETAPCADEDKDTYCDVCDAQIVTITKIALAGANMTLGNELKVNFAVRKNVLPEGAYAMVSQAGGEAERAELTEYNSNLMAVVWGVAAKEMSDAISVTIYNADGYAISDPYVRSVRDYGMTVMGGTKENLKPVVVDMLNYGAKAQVYFQNYNIENPANALLTDAQQTQYATATVDVTNDNQVKGQNYVGTNLTLEQNILMGMAFRGFTSKVEDLTATVSFTDNVGTVHTDLPADVVAQGSYAKVVVDHIVLADVKCPITVKLYEADGTQIGEGVDSVEGYVARNLESTKTDLVALNDTIMKFATSAKIYLDNLNA